jgi:hypothetical protein
MIGALVAGITGSGGASLSSYESIATGTISGGESAVTFSTLPSTFKHLQIRGQTLSGSGWYNFIRFNSDTGSNYVRHALYGSGSAAGANGATAQTGIRVGSLWTPGATYPTNFIVDILDFNNSSKNKTVRILTGVDENGSGYITVGSGLWLNTNAITSISFGFEGTATFNSGSAVALYGIKEA